MPVKQKINPICMQAIDSGYQLKRLTDNTHICVPKTLAWDLAVRENVLSREYRPILLRV